MTGNDGAEEEDTGVTDELADVRVWGTGGGLSVFSTEDLASRDLCVPVYMRKTRKKKRTTTTHTIKKR